MRGVTAARYHLLLGAGANFGGSSRDGALLPSGIALASELKSVFNLDLPDTRLGRAYKHARSSRTGDGADLESFIQARFTGVTPPEWMHQLVQLPWQRIWTLNIDDAVERAYGIWAEDAAVRARGVSWSESSSSTVTQKEWVHVVHLHGRASKASREGELVFTTSDYANAFGSKGYWHSHFAGEYESSPTIAVGASLDTEFDLENILERRKLSFDLPSFIVLPEISDSAAREYRAYDLTPVRATAADFFEALYAATTQAAGRFAMRWNHPMDGVEFERSWRRLDEPDLSVEDSRHDYYSGHAPEWSDVVNDLPVVRKKVADLVKRIDEQASGTLGVHVLTGEAYSGKSSALLVAARELRRRGYEPLVFSRRAALNAASLAEYSRSNPDTVFMIDGAEDFARDIGELAHEHGHAHTVRVLLVDRSRTLQHIKRSIPQHFLRHSIIRAELGQKEVEGLYEKLSAKSRLGHLSTGSLQEFVAHFEKHDNHLFDGMASVENGRGFTDRVGDSYDWLRGRPGGDLVRLAALASRFNYGVPLNSLTAAARLPAAEIARLVSETGVADYVKISGEELRIRSRHFGESLWNDFLPISEKSDVAFRLAKGVAPYVSPSAISDDSITYRIARSVMDEEFVGSIHPNSQEALVWYANLEEDYAWNARFWEQRALLASRSGSHEMALSWAVKAVSKLRDSFSLNTVGVVAMRRAVAEARTGKWPLGSFADAEQYLRESRSLRSSGTGRDRAEYPYVSFFSGVLDVHAVTGEITGKDRDVVGSKIMDWQVAVADLSEVARRQVEPLVNRVVETW